MAGGRFFSPNIITNLCLWLYVNELLRFLCTWSWRWFHRLQSVKTFCFWSANQDISMVYKGIFMLFRKNLLNFLTKKTGAGLKTPEIFVSGSSNKKWRHIRFKPGRAVRFTKRENGVSICQDFLLFATHQVRFLSNWGWEDVAGTFLRLWNWNFWQKTTFHYCFEGK